MDPKHLYFLSEIVRYGSLSRASVRLGVVQPTLTRIVKILEDQAGAPVLNRGRYGVTPTEIGERLAQTGSDIAEQVATASEAIDQWKAGIGQELRVGVGPMLALSVMPQFLEKYLAGRWPYRLKLTTATAGRLVERLNGNELDVVLAPARMNMHQERLAQEVMFEDRMAVYAGLKSKLTNRPEKIPIAELAQETWAKVGASSNIYDAQGEIFSHPDLHGVVPKIAFTGDISMALSLLKTTATLIPLPEKLTDACGAVRPQQKLRVDASLPPRDVAFWTTKANKDRPQILHFKSQMTKWLDDLFG